MNIKQVDIVEMIRRSPELLAEVERGQLFQITRNGKAIAELKPPTDVKKEKHKIGFAPGLITYMAPDFDAPLDDFREYM
jgi:antitoxin (DNA-binding transcriptional repressor) of toxin-antitoxin stability system